MEATGTWTVTYEVFNGNGGQLYERTFDVVIKLYLCTENPQINPPTGLVARLGEVTTITFDTSIVSNGSCRYFLFDPPVVTAASQALLDQATDYAPMLDVVFITETEQSIDPTDVNYDKTISGVDTQAFLTLDFSSVIASISTLIGVISLSITVEFEQPVYSDTLVFDVELTYCDPVFPETVP